MAVTPRAEENPQNCFLSKPSAAGSSAISLSGQARLAAMSAKPRTTITGRHQARVRAGSDVPSQMTISTPAHRRDGRATFCRNENHGTLCSPRSTPKHRFRMVPATSAVPRISTAVPVSCSSAPTSATTPAVRATSNETITGGGAAARTAVRNWSERRRAASEGRVRTRPTSAPTVHAVVAIARIAVSWKRRPASAAPEPCVMLRVIPKAMTAPAMTKPNVSAALRAPPTRLMNEPWRSAHA